MEKLNNFNSLTTNHSFVFPFENEFNYKAAHGWMHENFQISLFLSFCYGNFVLVGDLILFKRNGFCLKRPLVLWNLLLAVFCIAGCLRTLPELFQVLSTFGFDHSVCSNSFYTQTPVTSFWIWLFTLSKAPLLFDTVFVVLRKERLTFVHWYHHWFDLGFTWLAYSEQASIIRWHTNLSNLVLSAMYTYFALKSCGLHVSMIVEMAITLLQMAQMLIGILGTFYVIHVKLEGHSCATLPTTLYAALFLYVVCFILYAHYYIMTYIDKGDYVDNEKLSNDTKKSK